jgi:CRISPR-associated protein Csb2
MAVAMAFRFPLGEYHATPWDRAVNSGDSEWPPSPWRILRALLSVWHTRCPQLDPAAVERVIGLLASGPPSYLLPDSSPSHTRHYLPGAGHTEVSRDTAYTLAPRLQLEPDTEILVLWPDAEADAEDRQVLTLLAQGLAYLGRAESVCEARLLDPEQVPSVDERWTQPADNADELRVLAPTPRVTRAELEVTPDAMRKARRLVPSGAAWRGYRRGVVEPGEQRDTRGRSIDDPTAMRWALGGPVAIRERNGVLATSGLRASALWMVKHDQLELSDSAWLLAGRHDQQGVIDRHRHAHWLWLGDPGDAGKVTELVLWVPEGIPTELVAPLVGVRSLAKLGDSPKGYVPAPVYLQAMGRVQDVLPEVAVSSARWTSKTPMLTDRHPKERKDPRGFVEREVRRELAFRDWGKGPVPTVISVEIDETWDGPGAARSDNQAQGATTRLRDYRRYRLNESMAARRRGFRVTIQLDRAVQGPVSLGALSHFGFGLFRSV